MRSPAQSVPENLQFLAQYLIYYKHNNVKGFSKLDDSKQVVQYLEELAHVLTDLQVTFPFHILITGGAYMLLQQKRRSTLDIDFAIIRSPRTARPKKVYEIFLLLKLLPIVRKMQMIFNSLFVI